MITQRTLLVSLFFLAQPSLVALAADRPLQGEWILQDIATARANYNAFSTPIAAHNGNVYVTTVEPGQGGVERINDKTVIRRGRPSHLGWRWQETVIETRTLDDRYHTAGSVGVDRDGYVHVAYNMHNMPWQYSVSRQPNSIASFEFRGEAVTMAQLKKLKFENKTVFPNLGSAAIPGTQVTYPMFFNDRNGQLYVSYRFALRPGRSWNNRIFGAGLAKYDELTRSWAAIGGKYPLGQRDAVDPEGIGASYPLIYEPGWWVYGLTVSFDIKNNLHVSWQWREGGAGGTTRDPSYLWSNDGGKRFFSAGRMPVSLPVRKADVDPIHQSNEGYLFPGRVTASQPEQPWVHLKEKNGGRGVVRYSKSSRIWLASEPLPYGGSQLIIDDDGVQWSFGSGPNVFRRDHAEGRWQPVFQDDGYCGSRPVRIPKGFVLYTWDCKTERVSVLLLQET